MKEWVTLQDWQAWVWVVGMQKKDSLLKVVESQVRTIPSRTLKGKPHPHSSWHDCSMAWLHVWQTLWGKSAFGPTLQMRSQQWWRPASSDNHRTWPSLEPEYYFLFLTPPPKQFFSLICVSRACYCEADYCPHSSQDYLKEAVKITPKELTEPPFFFAIWGRRT